MFIALLRRFLMKTASLIAGLSAVALYLLCFQLKSAKKIIACKLLSSVLYVLQYVLLSAFVGAAMDSAAVVTSFFAYKKDTKLVKKFKIPILVVLHLGIVIIGLLLYENPFSILPIFGVLFESAAGWMKTEKMIRFISLLAAPCWLIYNLVAGAYGSAVGSVLAIISIILALVRYSTKHDKKSTSSPPSVPNA